MTASKTLGPADLKTLTAFAHKLADVSEKAVLARFRRPGLVDNKAPSGPFDPVTDADRDAETAIRAAIDESYPEHRVIGEEFGESGSSDISWLIDPIDGTKAFLTGSPLWGTLIGLMQGNKPLLGLMNQPFTQERYWSDGEKSWYRGGSGETRAMQTRSCPALSDAILSTTSIDLLEAGLERERFEALSEHVLMRRFGGDCYAYCLLAAGHIDLVVETGLKPHDIVPLIPIIVNAGGQISGWDGGDAAGGGRVVASGDARVHSAAVEVLSALS